MFSKIKAFVGHPPNCHELLWSFCDVHEKSKSHVSHDCDDNVLCKQINKWRKIEKYLRKKNQAETCKLNEGNTTQKHTNIAFFEMIKIKIKLALELVMILGLRHKKKYFKLNFLKETTLKSCKLFWKAIMKSSHFELPDAISAFLPASNENNTWNYWWRFKMFEYK